MQSLLRRGTALFTPSPSPSPTPKPQGQESESKPPTTSADFQTAPSPQTLFPRTEPATDGEECLHDCASCSIRYPGKFEVDQDDTVYGNVNGWAAHLLVATGKTDWVRDVADERGSVMEAVDRGGVEASNGKLKLSASNIPVPDEYHYHTGDEKDRPTSVLLLPAFTIIEHVTPARVPELLREFVDRGPTTTTPLTFPSSSLVNQAPEKEKEVERNIPTTLRSRASPHAAVILLCSQATRDARCGQSAPLLRREFERHLRPLGLHRDLGDERPGGVGIYFISHVGGHKYAANVIVYRRRDFEWYRKEKEEGQKKDGQGEGNGEEGAAQGIWLARVRPEDCENIIRFTVLQGKVVKPERQLRGGFDREKGLISW